MEKLPLPNPLFSRPPSPSHTPSFPQERFSSSISPSMVTLMYPLFSPQVGLMAVSIEIIHYPKDNELIIKNKNNSICFNLKIK